MAATIGSTITGQTFRTITNTYHSSVLFTYDGVRYRLQPGATEVMDRDMAAAAVEGLGEYGVVDAGGLTDEQAKRKGISQRRDWLLHNWRFALAAVQEAKLKGAVLPPELDRRQWFQDELDWVNKELGESNVYPTPDAPPKLVNDTATLQQQVAALQAQIELLTKQTGRARA
jgi:hypothetical protein